MGFQENLAALAPADHLARIELLGAEGLSGVIENKPGSQGSLRVYQHLAAKHGRIDAAAAREGLELYAEHSDDARSHPGKHPNIDRLLRVVTDDLILAARLVPAKG
jgi:hypothetical protein